MTKSEPLLMSDEQQKFAYKVALSEAFRNLTTCPNERARDELNKKSTMCFVLGAPMILTLAIISISFDVPKSTSPCMDANISPAMCLAVRFVHDTVYKPSPAHVCRGESDRN